VHPTCASGVDHRGGTGSADHELYFLMPGWFLWRMSLGWASCAAANDQGPGVMSDKSSKTVMSQD
jgi:hypothetical protein